MAKRRVNGEGGITRRKDGIYMARYTVQTAKGPTQPLEMLDRVRLPLC